MPHLSPMSWILTPLTFLLLLLLFTSTTWWHQTYSFPTMNISSKTLSSKWNWS
uniref:ATP synthase F0 subunit 8 n=1 Tax=Hemipodia simplex TaxID=1746056 RepID=A0A0S3CQV1_9ANNE|nr:ATP synthase F0 subunit 8 [Hemipodia simplex]